VAKTIAALQVALDLESAQFVKASDEAKRKANELSDSLEASGSRASKASGGMQQLAASKSQLGDVARNAGFQIQDFAVQVGSGQSAAVALGQQLPQLLSAFGTFGVVLGTVAAISIPLVAAGFQALVGNLKTAEEASKDLTSASSAFTAANNAASQSLAQLAGVFNAQAGPALKMLYEQLLGIAQLNLADKMRDFANSFIGNFASIARLAMPEFLRVFMDTPGEKLGKQFGITSDEAEKLLATLREFERGTVPFAVLRDHVLALQLQTRKATDEGRANIQQLLKTLTDFEEARSRLTPPQKAAQDEAKKAADARVAFIERMQIERLRLAGLPEDGITGAEAVLMREAAKHGREAERQALKTIELQRQITREKLQQSLVEREQANTLAFMENIHKRILLLRGDPSKGLTGPEAQFMLDALEHGPQAIALAQELLQVQQEIAKTKKDEAEAEKVATRARQEEVARHRARQAQLRATRSPQSVLDDELRQIQVDFMDGILNREEADLLGKKAVDDFNKAISKTKGPLEDLMRMVDKTGEQFTDTFVRMALTGKIEMGNMVNSIIADLMRMTVKSTITEPLFAFIKTVLPVPGRALGGPVEANKPYLVGEKGPELFVPRFAGAVVANSQMSTSGQTVNNYYINAIDTKSFEERLLQSNKTIWAAHTYASKSLSPAGRI
jgi:hypothetical protein